MSFKRHYVLHILFISIVVVSTYVYRPLLPIKAETKQSLGYPKDSLLNFTQLSYKYGYISEEHNVITEDGYILSMFRIQGRNCMKRRQPPVLLMHGLLQSSDSWLDAGPRAGLAYLLSDACYDLWVGNQRGNYYGRRHTTLNPDKDEKFWEFSVDEIGLYDIPAAIEYVLKKTSSKKVNYIGYSQGSGSFFIMCSERPGFCDKVNLFIGLAPASRQTHTRSVAYRALCGIMERFSIYFTFSGIREVFSKGALSQEFMAYLCQSSTLSNNICGEFIALLDSYHPGSITNKTTQVLFGHFPAGTSLKNFARYGQSMKSRDFKKFDYGKSWNIKFYGSEKPPSYNLSAVTVPAVVLYGKNDYLVDVKDVKWLLRKLPNVLEAVEVSDPLWNHLDMTYSRHTNEAVFPKINEYLLRYSRS
ncbi:lipase 1-like [Hyposmocoma kahamanoa]|uniref:lipase 1-like n=1 Tax=Hyposmocoma kahamanoa TaxID=1477025 RepID=UPI000E6D6329|nr:lipase 1-like [Hyposmocoma kahamanoa]